MLAWILEDAGLAPGFLIGGLPKNFNDSARLGNSEFFVIEADEYDTAFFDKRAKFVHYRPSTLVLNNLEFDHADIYRDIDAILWQFHQLLRIVPANGRIIANGTDDNLQAAIDMGCWTPVESFGMHGDFDWVAEFLDARERQVRIANKGGESGEGPWNLSGSHNLENALAAVAAAHSAGVSVSVAVDSLSRFAGVKRRMEKTATVSDIEIYDDFAHHPTAIRRTIESMQQRSPNRRIVVAIEPRSNTMKMGVHNEELAGALDGANLIALFRPADFGSAFDAALAPLGDRLQLFENYDELVTGLVGKLLPGDQVVFMSNGGFGAARQKLTVALNAQRPVASAT
jgi:UDP-N-acetylmuramate: L-alanyl-gamma-D-glutamyl-meso-diaminopimelate ligase